LKYINFNNAGASQTYIEVNSSIKKYLEVEYKYGGYYAAEIFKEKLDYFYINLSKLINCRKDELSFLPNTTIAWNLFFNSFEISKKQNIVILENDYGSNLISYKKKKINTKVVKINDDGRVCLEDLRSKIDKNTKAVCVCHIASQCGNIIEVEKIGHLIRKMNPRIFYIVDACQSIGHIKVDVKKIECDVLVGSGRKYLRGPRGTGFLFLNNKIKKKIVPMILDLTNSSLRSNSIEINNDKIFENFEYSPALKLGLTKAIEKINDIKITVVESDIVQKSLFFRRKLNIYENIRFFENKDLISGINTFVIDNLDSFEVCDFLLKRKILCSVSTKVVSNTYFKKKGINDLIRISFHQYNTYDEIDYLTKCLID
jgi:cysteine desulfurase / selenocysteine lyase